MVRYSSVVSLLQMILLHLDPNNVLSSPDVNATLKNTTFIGEVDMVCNETYAYFRGIRYGLPPVGEKRFQKSELYNYDEPVVDAKKYGNICMQTKDDNSLVFDDMEEDCLFLNVIVPLGTTYEGAVAVDSIASFNMKKAVYIFIHGGGFLKGAGNMYKIEEFAARGDVIVVTINYRLGIFGFLTTDDDVMPANLGLWDQRLAIQWVKQNIEAFGGDNSSITVGGQFAGSVSAILHTFYDGNHDLFQNTIAQSGSPMAIGVVSEKGLSTALVVAESVGCPVRSKDGNASSNEIAICLKTRSAMNLINIRIKHKLGPVLDNDFITKDAFELFPQKFKHFTIPKSISSTFMHKNLLIGFNTHDGTIAYQYLLSKLIKTFQLTAEHYLDKQRSPAVFQYLLNLMTNGNKDLRLKQAITDAIIVNYRNEKDLPFVDSRDVLRDVYFSVPSINTALLHSSLNRCEKSSSAICARKNRRKTYLYAFNLPHSRDQVRLVVPDLSGFTVMSWSNFIKTGNPNSAANPSIWKEYTENSIMSICEYPGHRVEMREVYKKNVQFWNEKVPEIQNSSSGMRAKREIICTRKKKSAAYSVHRQNSFPYAFVLFVCVFFFTLVSLY